MKITVLGAGSFGTSLSKVLGDNSQEVTLWTHRKEEAESLSKHRENIRYLPNVKLSSNIKITSSTDEAVKNADIIVVSVPSKFVRDVLTALKAIICENCIIVSVAKGLEGTTLLRMSEVIAEILPNNKIVALSGPSHAEEIAKGLPTTLVSASTCLEAAKIIQDVFMNNVLRVYTNTDVLGVELGGALKNVIALSAGISDGMGYGDNIKAALMTRGINEISRLGVKMGAREDTFYGLSGIGDLIVTCTSMHSRNRRAGILLGKGKTLDEAIEEIGMVVEGVNSANAAYELGKKYNIELPIVNKVYSILNEKKTPHEAIMELMCRERRAEVY